MGSGPASSIWRGCFGAVAAPWSARRHRAAPASLETTPRGSAEASRSKRRAQPFRCPSKELRAGQTALKPRCFYYLLVYETSVRLSSGRRRNHAGFFYLIVSQMGKMSRGAFLWLQSAAGMCIFIPCTAGPCRPPEGDYSNGKDEQTLPGICTDSERGIDPGHGLHRAHRHRLRRRQGPGGAGLPAPDRGNRGQQQHHQERQERHCAQHRRDEGHRSRRSRRRGGPARPPKLWRSFPRSATSRRPTCAAFWHRCRCRSIRWTTG